METYPDERLRTQLEKFGISRETHDFDSLKELLSLNFREHAYQNLNHNIDELAEIIIYLADKKIMLCDRSKQASKNHLLANPAIGYSILSRYFLKLDSLNVLGVLPSHKEFIKSASGIQIDSR